MKNVLCEILDKLSCLTEQLNPEEYSKELPILQQNTIGKHVRHILDLVECLTQVSTEQELNYDSRKRLLQLENSPEKALEKMEELQKEILFLDPIKKILLRQKISHREVVFETSVEREILYNIEHATHHLAIIRIGLEHHFPHIQIHPNFGIAHSTIQFREA